MKTGAHVLLCLSLLAFGGTLTGEESADETRKSALVESTHRALVQLDVTVRGPADVITTLTAEDFELKLGLRKKRRIRDFIVDRRCALPQAPAPLRSDLPAAGDAPAAGGASYLLYFDQHHLTFGGRARSLELARELIDSLVPEGQATIVSAGRTLRTFAPLTSDRAVLQTALDRIENDMEQWDSFPMEEDRRIEAVQATLDSQMELARSSTSFDMLRFKGSASGQLPQSERDRISGSIGNAVITGVLAARAVARGYQREEWWHTERALHQFSTVLARMVPYDSPKAVIYFADTMRANAGAHFIGLIGEVGGAVPIGGSRAAFAQATTVRDSGTTVPSFDWVIEEATAYGVRLYTVQAEGLVARGFANRYSSTSNARYEGPSPTASAARFRDAESSLVTFAAETGGRAFLRGVGADWIAREIRNDLACLYILSFDPGELPQDRSLPVYVRSTRPNVETRARAGLVIRSESSRLTSRLMAAFTAPEDRDDGQRLTALIIPTGFEKGKYSALVQVTVPGSPLPRVDWDLGISVVSRGGVRHESSGSISVRSEQVPVIFEAIVLLAPGPWELTAVAHDRVTDEIVSGRIEGDWPDPTDGRAMVGPIALLQPVYAAFFRDGAVRREGSLGRRDGEPVRSDLPTALVGIVCRQRKKSGPLRVERRLLGENFVEFPVIDLDPKGAACAIVSDVIPAGTMAAGMFQYELRVHGEDEDLAFGVREFAALTPDQTTVR